jgi:AhpC/TSA family
VVSFFRSLVAVALAGATAFAASAPAVDLRGQPIDPFATPAHVHVLLFVRTDCPITNRYAPELARIAKEFAGEPVRFWLVYPDAATTTAAIEDHMAQYHFPGEPLRDPHHSLVKLAHAMVSPEAAVFNASGQLMYHGRIDDRYVDIGRARPAAQTHDLEDAIRAVLAGKRIAQPETRAIGCSLADVE